MKQIIIATILLLSLSLSCSKILCGCYFPPREYRATVIETTETACNQPVIKIHPDHADYVRLQLGAPEGTNTYIAINLPAELKVLNKELIVEVRQLLSTEIIACSTTPQHPFLRIERARSE